MENKQTDFVRLNGGYILYKDGRIYSTKTKVFRTWHKSKNGYMKTVLYIDGKSFNITQHRVLAENFIPNPENKPIINHKNGIKHDNRISNIEWCTHSENSSHAIKKGMFKPIGHRKRRVIDISTGIIYESISDAGRSSGYTLGHFHNMLNSKNKTINKTTFKFYDRKKRNRNYVAGKRTKSKTKANLQ